MIRKETESEPKGSREALIRAGTDRFAALGFDGATVEAIASAAGVNKAMINYHFGGKRGLYQTILVSVMEREEAVLGEIANADLPADRKLGAFIADFASFADREPALPAMMIREAMAGGPHLDDEALPKFLAVFVRVREIVEQGMREGTFRAVNPLLTHLTVVGSLLFFCATRPLRDRMIAEGKLPAAIPTGEGFARHLDELMSRGLAAAREDAR